MLTTLLPPTSGSATVAGFDILRQPAEVRRRIGYVPQLLSADGSLKRPLTRWDCLQHERPSEDDIADWFRRWPDANIGIFWHEPDDPPCR
jgi:ABC-type Mn2+/Zn2+ transport system ATPase subunit